MTLLGDRKVYFKFWPTWREFIIFIIAEVTHFGIGENQAKSYEYSRDENNILSNTNKINKKTSGLMELTWVKDTLLR